MLTPIKSVADNHEGSPGYSNLEFPEVLTWSGALKVTMSHFGPSTIHLFIFTTVSQQLLGSLQTNNAKQNPTTTS